MDPKCTQPPPINPTFALGYGQPCGPGRNPGSGYFDLQSSTAYVWDGEHWRPLGGIGSPALPHGMAAPGNCPDELWPAGTKPCQPRPPTKGSVYLSLCAPPRMYVHNGYKWAPLGHRVEETLPATGSRPAGFGWPLDVRPAQTCPPTEGDRIRVDGVRDIYVYGPTGWRLYVTEENSGGGGAWIPVTPTPPPPDYTGPWPPCGGSNDVATPGDVVLANGCLYHFDGTQWLPVCCDCSALIGTGPTGPGGNQGPVGDQGPVGEQGPTGRGIALVSVSDGASGPHLDFHYTDGTIGQVLAPVVTGPTGAYTFARAPFAPSAYTGWPTGTLGRPAREPVDGDALYAENCIYVHDQGAWQQASCPGNRTPALVDLAWGRQSFSHMQTGNPYPLNFDEIPQVVNPSSTLPNASREGNIHADDEGAFVVPFDGLYDVSVKFIASGVFTLLTAQPKDRHFPSVALFVDDSYVTGSAVVMQPFYGGLMALGNTVVHLKAGEKLDARYSGELGQPLAYGLTQWEFVIREQAKAVNMPTVFYGASDPVSRTAMPLDCRPAAFSDMVPFDGAMYINTANKTRWIYVDEQWLQV